MHELPVLEYRQDLKYAGLRWYRPLDEVGSMWVDTAEGWANGDYSAISGRTKEGLLLFTYYWRVEPDTLAEIIDYIFDEWFLGVVAIERNNTGLTTLSKAKHYYWSTYLYKEKTYDKKTDTHTQKIWRHTNSKTRPLMLNDFEEAIRKGYITEIDERQKSEMYRFVYKNNRPEADKWFHDDAIISDAICWHVRYK